MGVQHRVWGCMQPADTVGAACSMPFFIRKQHIKRFFGRRIMTILNIIALGLSLFDGHNGRYFISDSSL